MRPIFTLVTAVVAVALPTAALADYTYTFQVPATTTNNVAGSAVQAECNLYSGTLGGGTNLSAGTSQAVPLTPAGGAYNGTLTVKVSSSSKPGSYKCWLLIYSGNSLINIINGTPENAASGWTGTMYTAANLP